MWADPVLAQNSSVGAANLARYHVKLDGGGHLGVAEDTAEWVHASSVPAPAVVNIILFLSKSSTEYFTNYIVFLIDYYFQRWWSRP